MQKMLCRSIDDMGFEPMLFSYKLNVLTILYESSVPGFEPRSTGQIAGNLPVGHGSGEITVTE